jgi:hypothetical protein
MCPPGDIRPAASASASGGLDWITLMSFFSLCRGDMRTVIFVRELMRADGRTAGRRADHRRGVARRGAGVRRALAAAGVASVLAAWGAGLPASAATSAPARPGTLETLEFGYVGPHPQEVTVPAGVHFAELRVIGGHGGGTGGSAEFVEGGDGAQVSGRLPVSPGQLLTLMVAGRGENAEDGVPGAGGWGATGHGGRGGNLTSLYGGRGGGGGGASSIGTLPHTYVVAAGGGGGGGTGFAYGFDRGGPGGSSGEAPDPGHNGRGPGAGQGGRGAGNGVSAGGTGGDGSHSGGAGGGGGAGIIGGAGGSGASFGGGGGGGGGAGLSDYSTLLRDPRVIRGGSSDGNGRIFITWETSSTSGVGGPAGQDVTLVPFESRGEAITGPASAGQPVRLGPKDGLPDQVWTLTSPGNPSITQVISKQTGLCLDVARPDIGAEVIAAACDGSPTQQWAEAGVTNGSYRLLDEGPSHTSLVLTAAVGTAGLTLEPLTGGETQDWLEQPLG